MKRKRRIFLTTLLLFVLAGLGACVYLYIKSQMDESEDVNSFLDASRSLQQQVVEEKSQKISTFMKSDEEPAEFDIDIVIDFDELAEINQDIIAWLYIPGTYISFPILQERVLMEYYYLNHDYTGERLSAGSIFTPAEPLGIEDAHLLLFGHNMRRDGVAFSGLYELYSTYESSLENRYIYLIYPDRMERWEVWCAVEGFSEDAVYEIPYQLGTESYKALLEDITKLSSYQNGEAPGNEEKTVVLSTCNGAAGGVERFYIIFRQAGTIR